MPETQTIQAPQQPAAPASEPREDLARQLTTLTDAMRQLAESHKTLLEVVRAQPAPARQSAPATAPADVGGDPGGGQRPAAVVDYSRLSPVQQIALGLKDSTPRGATRAGAD